MFQHTLLALLIPFLVGQLTLTFRCMSPRSVSEELDKSVAVFSGKAVAEEYRKLEPDGVGEVLVIKIKVERVWKGDIKGEAVMYTRNLKHGTTSFRGDCLNQS